MLEQKNRKRNNNFIVCANQGLTLVEVIIAVAIMSIVLFTALQVVLNASKMYTKTSESVDAQTEAQLLESQLNNLIVDAEYSVYAQESSDPDTTVTDVSGFSADAYIKVFNNSLAYYIAWNRADSKVYYLEKNVADGSVEELSEAEKSGFGNWYLMGEGVIGFSPDSSHIAEKQRIVTIKIQVNKGDVNYETIQNISLRNNVLESNDLDEIYRDEEVERGETVTEVQISPIAPAVNRGSSVEFHALVKSGGSAAASQSVTWKVNGAVSPGTVISDAGVLTVAADESAAIVTVTATAVGTDIYGQTSVVIPMIESVLVTTGDTTPPAGGRCYFTAQVIGLNLNTEAREVLWSVEPAVSGISISSDGVLAISSGVEPGTVVTVRATARVTAGDASPVTGSCSVTVGEAGTGGPHITSATGDYKLKRGGQFALYASGEGRSVVWSIVNDGGLGSKVSIDPATGVVTTARDIDFTQDYTITVKATPVGGIASEALTQTITLPKVSISFEQTEAYTVSSGTIARIPYTLDGLENTGMELSVSSTPSLSGQAGTFMYCTGSELVIVTGNNMSAQELAVTVSLVDNATVNSTVIVNVTN
ncbi:MAG: prepilin-type N-terminal cleavage/methylation domain-containing protein [Lachnospiraceae bacterium]|nr:prepilin-type N-terminal cleavage/methylation domain-containing protein [Lachnospiraceae bacterium]